MNFEFYNIYWLYSDLSDIEKKCYENRRKNAIKAFYRIINYTNLILPDKNEEDVKNLLTIFGDDYWRCGTNNVFRKKIPKNTMEISRFNSFNIDVKLYILDIIINLKKRKIRQFFIKIKNLLEWIRKKDFMADVCFEISCDVDKKLIKIRKEEEVTVSLSATEIISKNRPKKSLELYNFINEFLNFHIDIKCKYQPSLKLKEKKESTLSSDSFQEENNEEVSESEQEKNEELSKAEQEENEELSKAEQEENEEVSESEQEENEEVSESEQEEDEEVSESEQEENEEVSESEQE